MPDIYQKSGYLNSPFRLFYLEDLPGREYTYHYHDFHKLLIFLNGTVSYRVEGREYDLKPGDQVLIPAGEIHCPVVHPSATYTRLIAYISPDYFSTLSGGEQQRVILARALTQGSECLVLDEPTNHLDIKYQLEIMDIVRSLNYTVMAAIHDLNIACMYCDRLIAIRKGKVVGMGTPKELLTPAFIKSLYDVDCRIQNLEGGRLNIIYIPKH